jgi:hypothetical protein
MDLRLANVTWYTTHPLEGHHTQRYKMPQYSISKRQTQTGGHVRVKGPRLKSLYQHKKDRWNSLVIVTGSG